MSDRRRLGATEGGQQGFHGDPQVSRNSLNRVGSSIAPPKHDVADMTTAQLGARRDHAEGGKLTFRADKFAQYPLGSGAHGAGLLHGDRV